MTINKPTMLWLAIGAALLLTTALQAARAGRETTPMPQATGPAGLASREVAAEGRVVAYPGAEVSVGAERAGRLERVLVGEGMRVTRGSLLAEFESDELRAALVEAKARVREAEAETRLAQANLARKRQLVVDEIISSQDYDQATRDLETTQARVETLRATVGRIEAQLRKARILAPIAGTILLRHVDAGETIESGDRVVTLADLDRLRIEGEADEADANVLAVGAPVTITSDSHSGRSWKGRVEDVPDSVTLRRLKPQDPSRPTDTRVLAVKVAFAEATPLKLGTTVELRIAVPR